MALHIEHASYAYGYGHPVLVEVDLTLEPGERLAVVGANGAGKSTLGLLACGELFATSGQVLIDEVDAATMTRADLARKVGRVGQDARAQLVSSVVMDEVAFGPRNLGLPVDEVKARVARELDRCGLAELGRRGVFELSGGEQQRLALAGVLAMDCTYLVLDEVTSQLDEAMREDLRDLIDELAASGVGVLDITHELASVRRASRVALMDGGCLAWAGPVEAFLGDQALLAKAGMGPEKGADAEKGADDSAEKDGRVEKNARLGDDGQPCPQAPAGALVARDLVFSYGDAPVLDGFSHTFAAGTLTLVAGPSGAGKSSLAMLVAGLLKPTDGSVDLNGKTVRPGVVGLAFQQVEDQIFCNTVFDEVAYGPRNLGLPEDQVRDRVLEALAAVGLTADAAAPSEPDALAEDLLDRAPLELSGGQKRRVALASAIALHASAYVFDEPTAGLDGAGRRFMHRLARDLADAGIPVIVISHDVDEWRPWVDAELRLEKRTQAATSAGQGLLGTDGPLGSYVTRQTWLHEVDPLVKIGLLLLVTAGLFFVRTPLGFLAVAALLAILMTMAEVGPRAVARALRPAAVVLLFSLLANSLVVDGTGDLALVGMVGLSYGGIYRGVTAVARIALMVGFVCIVSATTTPPDLSDGLARALKPLRRIGVPVADVSTVLSLVLRLIPEAATTFERIRKAQAARGAPFDRGSLGQRLRTWLAVFVPLIVALFARADDLARAMRARAYTGDSRTEMTWRDWR